jgi:hypothetical protein
MSRFCIFGSNRRKLTLAALAPGLIAFPQAVHAQYGFLLSPICAELDLAPGVARAHTRVSLWLRINSSACALAVRMSRLR